MASSHDPTAPGTSSSAGGRLGDDEFTDDEAPQQALKDLATRLSELGEYVSYYISAKVDGIKISVRNLGIYAVLGILAGIAAMTLVSTAVVLLCVGIAMALGALFNSYWAGALVTGVLLLGLLAAGVILGMRWLTGSSRERTVRKYAARQQQERVKFGTDVPHRAADPAE